ncbi:MAG: FG-GAP-like repeat-containing protein [Pyrinomonadaceae bacterium]|nr:FG-GAP-like repeat-containing protein [Pyrinomonadaceae bacterium]
MKKRIALLALFIAAVFIFQTKTEKTVVHSSEPTAFQNLQPQTAKATAFAVSPKVSEIALQTPKAEIKGAPEIRFTSENQIKISPTANAFYNEDSALAKFSALPMPRPSLSFEGIMNRTNGEIFNFYYLPSDTNGDAGQNHYVQTVNALMRIYDKQGNPVTPPFKMSNIFASLNTQCAESDDGSPIVLYDSLADRWLLSQYCNDFPPFRQMVAISQTGDPTGAYFLYEFVMPNFKLNDFSKFGVWTDGYYMSDEQFVGSDFTGMGVFAFDRQKMLKGDASASYIYFDLAIPPTMTRLGNLLPSDLDGLNAPPPNAPNIFAGYTATEYGAPQDALRLFEFRADFQNPANSTFTERADSPLAVADFNPTSLEGRADITQPAPGDLLDAQSDRLNFRAAYRNFGTHESLVLNQTVRTTPTSSIYRAGVRVYELRRTNNVFTVHEQATIGDQEHSRWVASAAQDNQGNIGVGYSKSNEFFKPSIMYSGKLASEPQGEFRAEEFLQEGKGVQTAFGFRWGDYTGMTVDPVDDCTFWMTNQYYSEASQAESPFSWLTRIGSFKFAECTAAPRSAITGTVTNSASGQPIPNAFITASAYSRLTTSNGSYGNLFVLPNTYSITASAKGFRSKTFTVTVSNGQTLTQNFALDPVAVLENTAAQITAESCAPNNAVDPGETVTVNITFRNTGLRDTQNLTAILQATGGVTNPSAPQSYGVLNANGAGVARPFTFTVSPNLPCGANAVLTFALSDGAENLGNLLVTLPTGAKRIALQENFDSVTAPELPNGWTTSITGGQQLWTTKTTRVQSAPNAAFSPAPIQVGVNELVSPVFAVTTANAEISFRNWYDLETTFLRNRLYDGAVLEIKIGADEWQDIETAGGVFRQGGYDGVLEAAFQNPLGGRRGWSGKSGIDQTAAFVTSRAKLPASAAGQNVQFRWRVGTDLGTFREGLYFDDLIVTDGSVCACNVAPTTAAPFDFDRDGKTDISVFSPSDSANEADFFVRNSSTNSNTGTSWGSVGDKAVNADFDGDFKTDFAVFRPSNGTWYILQSADSTVRITPFGLATDKPVPADFDGDGKADISVFRPSNGVWYRLNSANNQFAANAFGQNGDIPVNADFDGDAKSDLAVFRPSNGAWFVLKSANNEFSAVNFGTGGDKPVVGDYDGDGKADYVVFRPTDGNWYLLRSQQGFSVVNFGLSSDKPLQADFDGDGRADIAVFRPANRFWFYLKSSDNSFNWYPFGANGATPVPSIFVE